MNSINPPTELPQNVTHKTFIAKYQITKSAITSICHLVTKIVAKNIRLSITFTYGRATNRPRYGRWKRLIEIAEPLLFLSTSFRLKTIISMPYCKLNPSL